MRPALDPFVFPSETRGWFRMLFLAALLVSLNLGFLVEQSLRGAADERREKELAARVAAVVRGRDMRDIPLAEIPRIRRELSPITRELQRRQLRRLAFPALCALFLLAITAVLYRRHPARIRRRRGARPVTAAEAPRVVGSVRRWAEDLGLPQVQLEYQDSGWANNAEAFGLRGSEVVLLYGRPSLWEKVWSELPQAVVLHEVGHIVNGDSQTREKTRAIWIALLTLLAVVFGGLALHAGLARLAGPLAGSILGGSWRLAVLLLIIATIWAGVVRARELHADQRVAAWGFGATLEQIFLAASRVDPSVPGRWWWSRLRAEGLRQTLRRAASWVTHPAGETRARAVADPALLFRISPNLAFVTGVLLAIVLVNFFVPLTEAVRTFSALLTDRLWQDIAPRTAELPAILGKRLLLFSTAVLNLSGTFGVFLAGVGGISYLLAAVLGVQVQKETIADLARRRYERWGYARLWWPALLLALGLEAGLVVTPFNPSAPFALKSWFVVPWLAGLTAFTWLWLSYIRALTRFTLGLRAGATPPRRLQRLVNASAALVLTLLYCPAGFWRMTHAFWAQYPNWSNISTDPREFFFYMYAGTGVMLLMTALVLYTAWALVSLGLVGFRLRRWRVQCPACRHLASIGFVFGRPCDFCGGPLAAWAYAKRPHTPAAEPREP
jgi:hypothetical protein